MTEENTVAAGETPVTPPEQPMAETPAAEEPKGPDGTPFDPERAKATIEKLRGFEKESEKLRKQVAAMEKKEQERLEAELSELEKAQKRLAELEAKAAQLERQQLQREVADKVGLPAALASRLQGNTADEMEADAAALLESLPKADKKPTTISATNPGVNANVNETHAQKKARLFGTQGEPFSESAMREKGGGVYFVDKT
jgi:hypothetical protein